MKIMTVCLLAAFFCVGCGVGFDEAQSPGLGAEGAVAANSQALRGPDGMPMPQIPGNSGDLGTGRPSPGVNRLPQDPVPTTLPNPVNNLPQTIQPIPTK